MNHASTKTPLQETLESFQSQMDRIDELELRLNARVAKARRRIVSQPIRVTRSSHIRVYMTHTYTPEITASGAMAALMAGQPEVKPSPPVWTLHIEGQLLIDPQLEYQSAKEFDKKTNYKVIDDDLDRSKGEEDDAPDMKKPVQTVADVFDKVVVTFQTVYETKASLLRKNTPKKKLARRSTTTASPMPKEEKPIGPTHVVSEPIQVVWERKKNSNQQDEEKSCHVLSFKYPQPKTGPHATKLSCIMAKVQIYRRYEYITAISSGQVLPNNSTSPGHTYYRIRSYQLQKALFPHVGPETTDLLTGQKRKWDDTNDDESAEKAAANTSTGGTSGGGDNNDTTVVKKVTATPIPAESLHNQVHIPFVLTMEEITNSFFMYIRDHKLTPEIQSELAMADVVTADKLLQDLLDMEQFSFSQLQQLLLQNQLIEKLNNEGPLVDPVRITYMLEQDASSTLGVRPKDTDDISILQFDMDITVPSYSTYRTRELLRRIKRRELEYTSSRTKARYSLSTHSLALAAANQATANATNAASRKLASQQVAAAKEEEERIVKNAIEKAVTGNTSINQHLIPVYMALAKAAPPNTEAQRSALLDARLAYLLTEAQGRVQSAARAWDQVEAIQEQIISKKDQN